MKITYAPIPDKGYDFSATPDDNYRPFKRRSRKQREDRFVAPEHAKHASYMERGYRFDHTGRKMVELGTELILDPRPTIMRPERNPIFLGLDQNPS